MSQIITTEFLIKNRACKDAIKFFKKYFSKRLFPEGLDLSKVEIVEDYKSYLLWCKDLFECERKYDSNGNLVFKERKNGHSVEYIYDLNGNCIEEKYINGSVYKYKYSYDDNNTYIEITYPSNITYKYKYDKRDNLIETIYPSGNVWKFVYDTYNNLIESIYPSGNIYKYTYDLKFDTFGRLIQVDNCYIKYL